MIEVKSLINLLKKNKTNFFTGVPDSVLKELSSSLQNINKNNHIIATNEGAAVSIGIGHYLSTKKNTSYLYAELWFIKCLKSFNFNCT